MQFISLYSCLRRGDGSCAAGSSVPFFFLTKLCLSVLVPFSCGNCGHLCCTGWGCASGKTTELRSLVFHGICSLNRQCTSLYHHLVGRHSQGKRTALQKAGSSCLDHWQISSPPNPPYCTTSLVPRPHPSRGEKAMGGAVWERDYCTTS